ncbi:hypothetical protein KGF57_001922 [Candida theae]|uniref:Uncharacterized protein n=1 Tax=Candida theae TaxID=1198502 RepID=A0AAD5BGM5_9ASCO|nr:uncharacterized protein KGF57_001922 [Candida theae]KAI5960526.1 hypothetical protein KGF57_001922 [Candida theae]
MSESSGSAILFGCSVAVVSSAIQSFGVTLQRKSHLLHLEMPGECAAESTFHHTSHHRQQKYRRNMWYFGFSLFIVANVLGSAIQISTLPLIILSPLQSIGLIFNSIFSCLLLPGEHFTSRLWSGTGIIALGACITAYNGSTHSDPTNQPQPDINESFKIVLTKLLSRSFLQWFIGTFVFMGCLLIINCVYLKRKTRECRRYCTLKDGRNNMLVLQLDRAQFWKGINYGIISGTLTAHTFLFAKSIINVIMETILKEGVSGIFKVSNVVPYLLLATMLAIIGLQLTAFNLGLAQISTTILYPLCFLVYNLVNLINDLKFNRLLADHKMTYTQFLWILFGLSGVLCGVLVLSWDSACQDADDGNDNVISINEIDHVITPESSFEQFKDDNTVESTDLTENSSGNDSLDNRNLIELDNEISDGVNCVANVSNASDSQVASPRGKSLTYEQNQLLQQLGL